MRRHAAQLLVALLHAALLLHPRVGQLERVVGERVQLGDWNGAVPEHCAPAPLKHTRGRVVFVAELPVRVQLRDAPNAVEPMLCAVALVALEWANEHAACQTCTVQRR